jgi:hypothetical protein
MSNWNPDISDTDQVNKSNGNILDEAVTLLKTIVGVEEK